MGRSTLIPTSADEEDESLCGMCLKHSDLDLNPDEVELVRSYLTEEQTDDRQVLADSFAKIDERILTLLEEPQLEKVILCYTEATKSDFENTKEGLAKLRDDNLESLKNLLMEPSLAHNQIQDIRLDILESPEEKDLSDLLLDVVLLFLIEFKVAGMLLGPVFNYFGRQKYVLKLFSKSKRDLHKKITSVEDRVRVLSGVNNELVDAISEEFIKRDIFNGEFKKLAENLSSDPKLIQKIENIEKRLGKKISPSTKRQIVEIHTGVSKDIETNLINLDYLEKKLIEPTDILPKELKEHIKAVWVDVTGAARDIAEDVEKTRAKIAAMDTMGVVVTREMTRALNKLEKEHNASYREIIREVEKAEIIQNEKSNLNKYRKKDLCAYLHRYQANVVTFGERESYTFFLYIELIMWYGYLPKREKSKKEVDIDKIMEKEPLVEYLSNRFLAYGTEQTIADIVKSNKAMREDKVYSQFKRPPPNYNIDRNEDYYLEELFVNVARVLMNVNSEVSNIEELRKQMKKFVPQ